MDKKPRNAAQLSTYVRRYSETFSVRKGQQLVVVEDRVQILHPLRIHISIKDYPLSLIRLSPDIVDDP